MPCNLIAESFHKKILCSRFSSRKVHYYAENGHFAFLSPLWGLRATYVVHLWLIEKIIYSELPRALVITELFSPGVTAEALRAVIHCVSKNIPDVLAITRESIDGFSQYLEEILLRKQASERCYIFPSHLINASALPCKTENTENASFHVNVSC